MKKLVDLFTKCLIANYIHTENDGDYALEEDKDTLIILFQCTNSKIDWKNNFDFPAVPYKDMDIKWRCHRGFLRVWKSIKPYIKEAIMNPKYKHIIIVGYSHGAAIATLCHEYVWFNRPDLRDNLEGYGFGCPRCYYAPFGMKKELKERWVNFHPIRNCNDIVTHVPPAIFGFRHVTKVWKLQNKKIIVRPYKLKCVNAHCPENILYSLDKEPEKY